MKQSEIILRPNKIAPIFFGWIILFLIGLVGSTVAAFYHGTLVENGKVIGLFGILVPAIYLLNYWYYMRFPILKLDGEILQVQVYWSKTKIPISTITKISKKRGFAAKPVFGRFLQSTRPYWRVEIHYIEAGQEKDVDFDLTVFRKQETEAFLAALKKLRPDLEIASLDKHGR